MWARREMQKRAAALLVAVLAASLNKAGAASVGPGSDITRAHAEPHVLAREKLVMRAMACEDELCLERELHEKLIVQAVRTVKIDSTIRKAAMCCETGCYYQQCFHTCMWWLRSSYWRAPECCYGSCGISRFLVSDNRAEADLRDSGDGGVDTAGEMLVSRKEGKNDELQEAMMSATDLKTVRMSLSDLTRGCAGMKEMEERICMRKGLDIVLVNLSRKARFSEAYGGCQDCPRKDHTFYCMCKNTCRSWMNVSNNSC